MKTKIEKSSSESKKNTLYYLWMNLLCNNINKFKTLKTQLNYTDFTLHSQHLHALTVMKDPLNTDYFFTCSAFTSQDVSQIKRFLIYHNLSLMYFSNYNS